MTQNVLDEVKRRKIDLVERLKFEKVSDVSSVKLKAGVMSSVLMVAREWFLLVLFLYRLLFLYVEAVRLAEPVVEAGHANTVSGSSV